MEDLKRVNFFYLGKENLLGSFFLSFKNYKKKAEMQFVETKKGGRQSMIFNNKQLTTINKQLTCCNGFPYHTAE